MKLSRWSLVVILVLISSAVGRAAGPHGTQYGQPYTDGGQVVLTDEVAQALADTGAGFVRVNFRLGNQPYDTTTWYAAYDGIVNRLRSRGLEIIGLMTNEAWQGGSEAWKANNYEVAGGNGWNSYLSAWADAFLRFATHWQGKIKYWELWNEPDCLAVIYPSNFGALLANCYDRARTNNLPVEIISGGVCGVSCTDPTYGPAYITKTYNVSINNTGWFTQMKNKWGTYPLDHIGFHIYPNCNTYLNTSWLSSYFDCVRNAYTAFEGTNTTKKLWLTEFGWMTDGAGCHTTEAVQAANITSAFGVINGKSYIKCATWFFLQDVPSADLYYGVFRSSGLTEADKKPGWTNLKTQCTFEGRWSAGGSTNQPILDYYNANGHAKMGNPYDNGGTAFVHNWDYGPVQDFDGGDLGRMTVFDASDGVGYCVRGDFWQAIVSGSNHPNLEFPLGDQFFTGVGNKQFFEGGYMTWTQAGGTQVTLYANKLPLDNSDTGFSYSSNWTLQVASDGYKDGKCRKRAGTTTNSDPCAWTIAVPSAGTYDVYARWPTVTNAASSAVYEIVHASGTATATVNQKLRVGRWNKLGTYQFNAGNAVIRLSSQGLDSEYRLADAVRLIGPGAQGPDTTPPTIPIVTDDGQYTTNNSQLSASWESQDMESGINHYEYAIGTSPTDPGSGYVVPWTSTGTQKSVTKTFSLTNGVTYYFYVRAYNNAGLMSAGVSDGIKADFTAPTAVTVTDDGDFTGDANQLHCTWSATDPESGIGAYEYLVGTTPTNADVVLPTNVGTATEVWVTGLNLAPLQNYYFRVRARNNAGLWSGRTASDGIRYQIVQQPGTIAAALARTDYTNVLLKGKLVSALYADRFYIQEPDRSHGIGVTRAVQLAEGSSCDVTGTLQTIAGERFLAPGAVTPVQ